ncbi:hypothetical protein [Streptomyces sp. NPDC052015]|uniref:hypothetical protein n=1 Tax=Streptomyces sp. NPDC052015 TaxID=3154755 RepID=UPI003413541F
MTATGYTSTSGDARKVSKAGDTMTGELTLPDSSPDAALNAASKGYVDTGLATKAAVSHASTHASAGSDPVTLAQSQITGLVAALAAKLTGPGTSTDNALPRFDGTTGLVLQNSTVVVGDDGSVTITGNLTDAGDLLIRNSHTEPTKAYRFRSSGGSLDTEFGGADWYWSNFPNADFSGTQRNYMRWENGAATIHLMAELQCKADAFGARVHTLNGASNTLGFHGATPVAKQTVSGSRGGNAALASLITALATLGLITDGTSA